MNINTDGGVDVPLIGDTVIYHSEDMIKDNTVPRLPIYVDFIKNVQPKKMSTHRPYGAADPSGGTHRPSGSRTEAFTPVGGMDYPKLGDAFKNSWYDTFGRECKHHKCKVWNGHNYQYFCSENKNCRVPEQNLQGKRMKNMSWFERYV